MKYIDIDWITYTVHAMTLFSVGIMPEYFVMEIDKFKIFFPDDHRDVFVVPNFHDIHASCRRYNLEGSTSVP